MSIRRAGLAVALLAALAPALSRADSALYLTWDDCPLGLYQSNFDFACDTEEGFEELYCAFSVPFTTGADVLGVIAVVDIQGATPILSDWWRLGKLGGCRSGYLSASADFTTNANCMDPWRGHAVAEVQAYNVGEPHDLSQARIKAVCGVVPDSARTLDVANIYYGIRLVIQNIRATGANACTGCRDGACLVLNSIEVKRLSGAPGGDLFLQTPGPNSLNWALWRGAAGASCAVVPVRNMTWGRVKSLYR